MRGVFPNREHHHHDQIMVHTFCANYGDLYCRQKHITFGKKSAAFLWWWKGPAMVVRPPRQRPPGEFFPGPSFDGPGGLQTGLQTLEDGTGHLLVEGPVQFAYGRTSFTGWGSATHIMLNARASEIKCFANL